MSDLPEVTEIQRYRYEPGDKLIVTTPERITMEIADHLCERVSVAFEVPVTDVLLMSDGILIEVVSQPARDPGSAGA